MEREKVRNREPLRQEEGRHYEETLNRFAAARERARIGKVVIRGRDLPWIQNRMGRVKSFLSWNVDDTAVEDWTCFIHDIKVHSGRHRHQGGINLFVLEGEGYTVVDGRKVEWERGDLIILPVKQNGCEHQHFNRVVGKPAKWMAFKYSPFSCVTGNIFEHVEDSPVWKGEK